MNRTEIEGLVSKMYSARLANDAAACIECFAKGAQLTLAGDEQSVYQAKAKVPANIEVQINALIGAWTWHEINHKQIVIEENKVAVSYELKASFNPTGEQITTMISDHIVVSDDCCIEEFVEFVDTAMVERLAASI